MDWPKIIADLCKAGWTQQQIADAVGRPAQSWVSDLAQGKYKDISWTDGEKLRKLHARVMRKSRRNTGPSA